MSKKKLNKMVLWSCEKYSQKKCGSEYPCQMMLPKHTIIEDEWCAMRVGKALWKKVPVTKLAV